MIKGRKLDHIGLAVTDLEASKAWYCDVLGFEVIGHFYADGTPAYFLKNGDTVYEMYEESASARFSPYPSEYASSQPRWK